MSSKYIVVSGRSCGRKSEHTESLDVEGEEFDVLHEVIDFKTIGSTSCCACDNNWLRHGAVVT